MVVRFIPPQQNVSKGLLSSDDPLTPNSLLMPSTLDLPVQREDEQPNPVSYTHLRAHETR